MFSSSTRGYEIKYQYHSIVWRPVQKYAITYITMVFCYQNCSSDREKLLKFEAEGQEFAKILRSLKQFIQKVKGHNNNW